MHPRVSGPPQCRSGQARGCGIELLGPAQIREFDMLGGVLWFVRAVRDRSEPGIQRHKPIAFLLILPRPRALGA